MNNAVCELFISGKWHELNRSAFLTVKYHNPENLIFQHIPTREKISSTYENNGLQNTKRSRNGVIIGTLNFADIVETVKGGGFMLEVYEGFFCHDMQYTPYTEIVNDMAAKRDLHKEHRKDLLQALA